MHPLATLALFIAAVPLAIIVGGLGGVLVGGAVLAAPIYLLLRLLTPARRQPRPSMRD